ncbi:MAG: PSD1 domain-containing protein [Planctomycetaceae bacterium]|nr:PSD1 domain-containing protein [Planctomycetaceae bacterium]
MVNTFSSWVEACEPLVKGCVPMLKRLSSVLVPNSAARHRVSAGESECVGRSTYRRSVSLIAVLLSAGFVSPVRAVDFDRDIQPLLISHCAACHGGVKKQGGFSVISRHLMFAETDSGSRAVQPGDPDSSEMIRRIRSADPDEQMPPADQKPLTAREKELLTEWIREGAEWPQHWAYLPLPSLPSVDSFGGANPIDWFVRQKLSSAGFDLSPPADRLTMLRRLSLDLTGLLPTEQDLGDFADTQAADFAAMADRYLASPHFGERWARHWLDEARYADSEGYEKDSPKEDAWLYRDWVVNACNSDLPYDEFTRKQIAGDLLPDGTEDDLIATKFHLQTQFNLEGGVDSEEDRTKRVIDRVGTIGTVWLGTSIGCCQCHDHPYDGLRTDDFYRLYAMFNNADFAAGLLKSSQEDAAKKAKTEAERAAKWEKIADLLERQRDDKDLSDDCQRELSSLRAYDNSKGFVRYIRERTELRRPTYILARGDFRRPMTEAGEIAPGVPALFASIRPRGIVPDRLDLANWLVTDESHLTARVAVNKIWMHLFGAPLAGQPQEFGSRGDAPSHPELLDFLARWFVDEAGWSRKKLIRLIVLSETWQQSAADRPEVTVVDPSNRLLSRQNRFRVEAEILRDISLQAGGLLHLQPGGKSVFPPLPEIIAQQTYAGSFKYKASTGTDRFRRGLYTFFRRTAIDPNLSTFDCPDSSLTKAQRDRSNNALQALATMHNEVFHESAQAFARRLLTDRPEATGADAASAAKPSGDGADGREAGEQDQLRLNRAFRIALGRRPRTDELQPLLHLLTESRTYYAAEPESAAALVGDYSTEKADNAERAGNAETAAWICVTRIVLNLDEFVTRG